MQLNEINIATKEGQLLIMAVGKALATTEYKNTTPDKFMDMLEDLRQGIKDWPKTTPWEKLKAGLSILQSKGETRIPGYVNIRDTLCYMEQLEHANMDDLPDIPANLHKGGT